MTSTPIPCRVCDLMRPLWSPLPGQPLPGGRCKCVSMAGYCKPAYNAWPSKILDLLKEIPAKQPRRSN